MCPVEECFVFFFNYRNQGKKKTIPEGLQEKENHGLKYSMVVL